MQDNIDLLDRKEFVDDLIRLVNFSSEEKRNYSIALNGSWGCGKTFILDMFEEEAKEKHFIFRYNCWENDYYEEPLIAIISILANKISNELVESKKLTKKDAKEILNSLLIIAGKITSLKIGFDPVETIKEVIGEREENIKNSKLPDELGNQLLTNSINEIRSQLTKLTDKSTVVIVVDELDRCLPEYAISVLERLHHLFSGLNNLVVITSFDKKQLTETINRIFGDCNRKKYNYLEKFFDFELKIDVGSLNSELDTRFKQYLKLFDESINDQMEFITDFRKALFEGIEIRTRLRLIDRAELIHRVYIKEKCDVSFLCYELFWITMFQYYNYSSASSLFNDPLDFRDPFRTNSLDGKPIMNNETMQYLKGIFNEAQNQFASWTRRPEVLYFIINDESTVGKFFWHIIQESNENSIRYLLNSEYRTDLNTDAKKRIENTKELINIFDRMVKTIK